MRAGALSRGNGPSFRGPAGPWARWVARPLAARLLRLADRPGVRPWHLTLVGLASAAGAAVLFLRGDRTSFVLAAALAQMAVVCDFADGALARRRGGSAGGAVLDGIADALRIAGLAAAVAFGAASGGSGVAIAHAGALVFLTVSLVDAAISRIVCDLGRALGSGACRRRGRVDRALLRAARVLEARGLRLVVFGFNEREAVAFCIGPLLGAAGAGLLVAGLLSLPFLTLRLLLDLALAREAARPARTARGESLVLVGAGFWQCPIVEAARRAGLQVVAIDRDPEAPAARLADQVVAVSAHDANGALVALRQRSLGAAPIGVLSGGARGCTHTAAVIAQAFGLPGLDPSTARNLGDKARLRGRLSELGLNTRPFALLRDVDGVRALFEFGPVVLKPCGTSGGRGIFLIKDPDEAACVFDTVLRQDPEGLVLAESYAPGRDVGVAGVARDGVLEVFSVFDKVLAPSRAFGRPGLYLAPSALDASGRAAVEARAVEASARLGVSVGPFYGELRVADDAVPETIEVEAAVPGSFIASYLVPESSGRDYLGACLAAVTGQAAPEERSPPRTAACRFAWSEDAAAGLDDCSLRDLSASGIGAQTALLAAGEGAAVRRLLGSLG